MRWPWQRRARAGAPRHALPRQAARWAEPAFPPAVPAPAAPVPAAPAPMVAAPAVAVQLGFRDGSALGLPADDPRAKALRAVADLLVQDPGVPAEK